MKALLYLRKVDTMLYVSNHFSHLLATIDAGVIKFHQPVTADELNRINEIAQDEAFFIANITEN